MDLIEHARRELQIRGDTSEQIEAYLNVVRAFVELTKVVTSTGHADETVMILFNGLLLTPLTDWRDDWYVHSSENYHGFGELWQSKRNMRAFSTDCGETYYTIGPGAKNRTLPTEHDKRLGQD